MAVKVHLHKKSSLPGQQPLPTGGLHVGERFVFYGMVTEVHSKSNTVNVRMDTGREIANLRVASLEWVTIDDKKDFLSGQRRLPPVDTLVVCLAPTGDPASAIVLCSVFGFQIAEHADFKEDSEDAKHTRKRVTNSGWVYTEDNRTGTKTIQNKPKDETIKFEIDQEENGKEKVTVTIHGNVFTVDKDNGLQFQTDKNIEQKIEGDYNAEVKGKVGITADGAVTLKSNKTELLELGNTVATLGKMVSDLLQAGVSFKSVGSPAAHTAPDFSAKCGEIKAKWDQVFK